MKKTLLTILLGTFGTMALVTPTLGATNVFFAPIKVDVRQGQVFTLVIGVNPQGVKNYVVKTELHYPPGLLEARSFTFLSGWLPLSQAGYDLINNTTGVLIKTAGYPGGVSAPVAFGTVSFRAKQSGVGVIRLDSNSFILDANSQNVLANAAVQTAVAVSATAGGAPVSQPSAPATSVKSPAIELTENLPVAPAEDLPITEVQESPASAPPVSSPIAPRSLSASVGSIVSLGTDSALVGIVVVLIVAYVVYALIRRSRRQKLN